MTENRKLTGAAVALIAALVLAGCGNAPGAKNGDPNPGATVTTEAPPVEPDEPNPDIGGDDGPFGLTDTAVYGSGVEVTLSKFSRGDSGEYASPGNTPYVMFTVKVTNGSSTQLNMAMIVISCQHGEVGQESEEIFESDRGLSGSPSTHLLPGRSASFKTACEMPDSESYLQVEIAPDFGSEASIFAGKIQ